MTPLDWDGFQSTEQQYRTAPAHTAIAAARRCIDQLGSNLTIREYAGGPSPVLRATLSIGDAVVRSAGKGLGVQAEASCLFELIEHYFARGIVARLGPDRTALVEAHRLASVGPLRGAHPVSLLAETFPSSAVGCLTYASWPRAPSSRDAVPYPALYVDQSYRERPVEGDRLQYATLVRYMSSCGVAAGMTEDEAVYHGICERIEHDATSHFLLSMYIAPDRAAARWLDRSSCPDRIRALWEQVERSLGQPVHVLDTTTDLAIPAYLALPEDGLFAIGLWGAGASLCPVNACERALLELRQDFELRIAHRTESAAEAVRMTASLAPFPSFAACAGLSAAELLSRGQITRVPLGVSSAAAPDLSGEVHHLTTHLERRGHAVLVCDLAPAEALSVVSVVIPGLDHFTLVRGGVLVVPTGRGSRLWPGGATRG